MTRKIDDLGRVVIPIELREKLGIKKQDQLEIYVDNETIILTKSGKSCIFCNSHDGLTEVKHKFVCSTCLDEMNK
jgi:transcriptional pleiotropic regulator of transition state genes